MIGACETSQATKPVPRASDPIVETVTVERQVCPAELLAPVPKKPARPAGGSLTGDPATLGWVGQLASWGEALRLLFTDAAAQCP
jgi:hypothetical protein